MVSDEAGVTDGLNLLPTGEEGLYLKVAASFSCDGKREGLADYAELIVDCLLNLLLQL